MQNSSQRQAVLHGTGPAIVAAGPGSGKTFTITHRLLYLIGERKVSPQEILVITFTKEAAKTMQERFFLELQRLGRSHINQNGFVSFGTFHSFFYQIIRSMKKYSAYQLITPQEKRRMAGHALKKIHREDVEESDIQNFLSQISFYKNTGEFPAFLASDTEEQKNRKRELLLQTLEVYEEAKHACNRLDFDDMLSFCLKEFEENQELLSYWQWRFTYVCVDEFQDINPIQYKLICLLCAKHRNLFVVGDDDQSIYGFRGSRVGIFEDFLKDFPESVQIQLAENYRCSAAVVKASKSLIEHNEQRVFKELVSVAGHTSKGKVSVMGAVTIRESQEKVIQCLKGQKKGKLSQQAVLFRTNLALQSFAAKLTAKQIPFMLSEKPVCIYEHFIVRDIMDYFKAAAGCRDRSLFIRMFQKQTIPLGREALLTEQVDFTKIREMYDSGFCRNKQALAEVEALERNLQRLAEMRPALGIKFILHAMGYQGYLIRKSGKNKELSEDWNKLLDWFMEDAQEFGDYKVWKAHQELYAGELERGKLGRQKNEGVHLMTLHASKGLEFQKVYIMNLNEGNIPQFRRGEKETKERLEEERRLLYVGMTRAKEELELHYVTGTKENPRLKSRFLEELKT